MAFKPYMKLAEYQSIAEKSKIDISLLTTYLHHYKNDGGYEYWRFDANIRGKEDKELTLIVALPERHSIIGDEADIPRPFNFKVEVDGILRDSATVYFNAPESIEIYYVSFSTSAPTLEDEH